MAKKTPCIKFLGKYTPAYNLLLYLNDNKSHRLNEGPSILKDTVFLETYSPFSSMTGAFLRSDNWQIASIDLHLLAQLTRQISFVLQKEHTKILLRKARESDFT